MKTIALATLLAVSSLAQATEYEVVNGHRYFNSEIYFTNANTGQKMDTFYKNGKTYIAGKVGDNYEINLCGTKRTPGRNLYVVSVDGLNVISGEPASYNQTGYVVSNGQCSKIKGWRKNMKEEAKFVLTASSGSYATRTNNDQRNIGVIGFAVFNEDVPMPAPEIPLSISASKMNEASVDAAGPSAPMMKERAMAPLKEEKIGTGHGERVTSQAKDTEFKKASDKPYRVMQFYYDSYDNLVSKGIIAVKQDMPNAFPGERQFAPDPKY